MPWNIQLRDERGQLHRFELPSEGDSTILELKRLVNKASKAPHYKQIWKTGFPPTVVLSPWLQPPNSSKLSSLMTDRSLIVLEVATPEQIAAAAHDDAAADAAEPAAAAQAAEPSHRAAEMATQGGDDRPSAAALTPSQCRTDAACASAHGTPAASATPVSARASTSAASSQGGASGEMVINKAGFLVPKPKRRKRMHFPGSARLIDGDEPAGGGGAQGGAGGGSLDMVDAMRNAEDGVLGALLQAARGGAQFSGALGADWNPGSRSVFKALRADLKNARDVLGKESVANDKLAAVRAGQVSYRDLSDGSGRVEVTYKAGRKELKECVPGIPTFLLAAVLISLFQDEDAVTKGNLTPLNMAQASPRIFWALVRHGPVGPNDLTFEGALKKLVPSLDWAKLDVDHRSRRAPSSFSEYEAH